MEAPRAWRPQRLASVDTVARGRRAGQVIGTAMPGWGRGVWVASAEVGEVMRLAYLRADMRGGPFLPAIRMHARSDSASVDGVVMVGRNASCVGVARAGVASLVEIHHRALTCWRLVVPPPMCMTMCTGRCAMRTNIELDATLIEEAFRYADVTTKKDLVHLALREFVERHR